MSLTRTVPPRADDERLTGLPVAVDRGRPGRPCRGGTAARAWHRRGRVRGGRERRYRGEVLGPHPAVLPVEYLVDEAAARLLDGTGWEAPAAKRLPYGRELVDDYLTPLASTPELAPRIR